VTAPGKMAGQNYGSRGRIGSVLGLPFTKNRDVDFDKYDDWEKITSKLEQLQPMSFCNSSLWWNQQSSKVFSTHQINRN
jgi:hypothetical protein